MPNSIGLSSIYSDVRIDKDAKMSLRIINIILLIYPFENFSIIHIDHVLGLFSPFRIIILPLCVLFFVINSKRNKLHGSIGLVLSLLYFLIWMVSILGISIEEFGILFGNIVQFYMAYVFFQNYRLNRHSLYIVAFWGVINMPIFFIKLLTGEVGMSQRFLGHFFDPNYLCAFIIPSFWSLIFLQNNIKFLGIKRVVVFAFATIDVFMILLSFSRGGILSLLLTVLLWLYVMKRKTFYTIVVASIPLFSYLMVIASNISWTDGANSFVAGLLYRFFTVSGDATELTGERSDFIEVYLHQLQKGDFLFWGIDLESYRINFNEGHYPHNGLIEILLHSGFVVGLSYIGFLFIRLAKFFFFCCNKKIFPFEFFFVLGIFFTLVFLSFSTKIAWLSMGCIFSFSLSSYYRNRDTDMLLKTIKK